MNQQKTVTRRNKPNFSNQADSVVIPLEVEHALSYHLGKRSTHGLVGERSLQSWVRISQRLVRNLEKYIEVNVDSDRVHHEQLLAQLKKMKEALSPNSGRKREPILFMALLNTCLLLLGMTPDHWNKRVVNKPEYFRLSAQRSCHYTQTASQRVNVIIWAKEHSLIPEMSEADRNLLRNKASRMPARSFLDWFRNEYPKAYLSLF